MGLFRRTWCRMCAVKSLFDADAAQLVSLVFQNSKCPASPWTVPLHDGMYHARHLLGQPQADFGQRHFMAVASLMYWYYRKMHFGKDLQKQSLI